LQIEEDLMSSTAKMAGIQFPSGKMLIDGKWCEAASGMHALELYTQVKSVWVNLAS
jgi:hypothetical protein